MSQLDRIRRSVVAALPLARRTILARRSLRRVQQSHGETRLTFVRSGRQLARCRPKDVAVAQVVLRQMPAAVEEPGAGMELQLALPGTINWTTHQRRAEGL